jgi:TPP-dependent pyruvate/acetoin dehydrogenase alpha subunit/pyruvate/2-oxoglutarate/acetoin dehydrogenase E1 component
MANLTTTEPTVEKDKLLDIYRRMLLIRSFEERAQELFQTGQLPRRGHLYAGQEAVAAATLVAVNDDDYVTSTHRGHGHAIGRGGNLLAAMAELGGKSAGFCRGKGGSMHVADLDHGMLGAFPIVGASITMAVGGALAARVLRNGRVAVAFFGDGASNQGTFHEGLNLAAIWDLPVIFVCENNQYAIFTKQEKVMRVKQVADRAPAYGIPGVVVDGMDPMAVYRAVREAADRARAGKGPTLIEAMTYRWGGHSTGDPGTGYRDRDEVAEWKKKDPIPNFRRYLLGSGAADEAALRAMEDEVARLLAEAVDHTLTAPDPDPSEATAHLYAPAYQPETPQTAGEGRELTVLQALNEAIREEMELDPRLIMLGEDIGARGGPFGVSKGLLEKFGPDRILETPISENGFTAAAVGAALAGVPTIVEISYIDFITLAMDPIVNVAAKAHYMSGGKQTAPVVIRTEGGGGSAADGPTHSQSLEAWFAHVPGLKVVMPSTPYDYKGLLKTAIRDPNPVLFIEHKMLYRAKGPVPAGEYAIPLGLADVKRHGSDVTVVAFGAMVPQALVAADLLAKEGIEIEVIDPRTLVPFDVETVAGSVRRTGRLVILQEAPLVGGFGSEITRAVGEAAFDYLEAPIKVVAPTVPLPASPPLEAVVLPGARQLIDAIRELLGRG